MRAHHEIRRFLTRTTDPVGWPVTLSEVKRQLRVTHNDDDERLQVDLIPSAVDRVETDTQRGFLEQHWQLVMDAFPDEIELRRCPVFVDEGSAIVITYVDGDGDTVTLATDQYQVDSTTEPGLIKPAFGLFWPTARLVPNAVTVAFSAGYASAAAVPDLAKSAIKVAVEEEYYGCDLSKLYESYVSRLHWGGRIYA